MNWSNNLPESSQVRKKPPLPPLKKQDFFSLKSGEGCMDSSASAMRQAVGVRPSGESFMYSRKRLGPGKRPWGTPGSTSSSNNKELFPVREEALYPPVDPFCDAEGGADLGVLKDLNTILDRLKLLSFCLD